MGGVWNWKSKIKNNRVNANLQTSQIEKKSKESSCSSSHQLVGRYWFIWCDGSHGTQTQGIWLWWMGEKREMLKDGFIWHHLLCGHQFHDIVTDNDPGSGLPQAMLRTTMCCFSFFNEIYLYRYKAKNLIFKIFGFGSRKKLLNFIGLFQEKLHSDQM